VETPGKNQVSEESKSKTATSRQTSPKKPLATPVVDKETERTVGISVDELAALYLLDAVKGFGPQKFKQLHESGCRPADLVVSPDRLALAGRSGDSLREQLKRIDQRQRDECGRRAAFQITNARKLGAHIVTYVSEHYPANVLESNNPVPILYVRGSLEVLAGRATVAAVGSRGIRAPYSDLHREFARTASDIGVAVVSGFATGTDAIGHEAALLAGGTTILVLPSGVDRPFPPENRPLWEECLRSSKAAIVSEFAFGTGASKLTLRKRNKLIVSFGRAVLIAQSSEKGGAMNAYRTALEQRKPIAVFEADGTDDTTGNSKIAREGTDKAKVTIFASKSATKAEYERWLRESCFST
jgi:DNA processing protein